MTKLKLDLYDVMTNLYTKNQVNISKDGREKSGKLNFKKGNNSRKIQSGVDETQTWSLLCYDEFIYQISSRYLKKTA